MSDLPGESPIDHTLDEGLRARSLSGGIFGIAAAVVTQGASVVSTVVLARLLLPADFGVVAAATVVLSLFDLVAQVGLGPMLVRRPTLDARQTSTAFWIALLLGLGVAAASAAVSPLVAELFDEPRAGSVLAALALMSTFGFVRTVPAALLQRAMRYRTVYSISAVAVLVNAVVSIVLAAATDLGPWCIVLGRLSMVAVDAAACFIAAGFRPQRVFAPGDLRDDFRFSAAYWANGLVVYGAKNADYWTVGRVGSAATLGVYYVAYVLPNILRLRLTWVMSDVLLPAFARIQDDVERLRRGYLDALELLACLAFPSLLGLAVLAGPVVEVFFGDKWAGAARPMSLLAVAALVDVPGSVANAILFAIGRATRNLVVNVWRGIVMVVSLAVAVVATDGLVPIAVAVLVATAVSAFMWLVQLRAELGVAPDDVRRKLQPVALAAVLMVGVVQVLESALRDRLDALPLLAVCVVAGVVVYVGLLATVARATWRRVRDDVRRLRSRQPITAG